MKFLSSLKSGLFEPERKVTPGELVFFKFFEFFVLLYTIWFSWKWARYIFHRNTEVVLPLGYANYLDVSLFFGNHLPFYMAGILTVLLLCAYFRIGARWFYMVAFFLLHQRVNPKNSVIQPNRRSREANAVLLSAAR